jgi:hypothetical protein
MIERLSESEGPVVGYRVQAGVTREHYERLIQELEQLNRAEGPLNLLTLMVGFHGHELGLWWEELRFGLEREEAIVRWALVGDSLWQSWLADLSDTLIAGRVRHYGHAELPSAWQWLSTDVRHPPKAPGAQFYCPSCFAEVKAEEAICPQCRTDIAQWLDAHTYHERLIHALSHPISEVRMGSIIALGKRRDPRAARPLAECALAFPVDVVQGLEILEALARMPAGPEKQTALTRLTRHPAGAVQKEAGRILAAGIGTSRSP